MSQSKKEKVMAEIDSLIINSIRKHSDIIMFTLDRDYRFISFSKKYQEIVKKILDKDIQVGDYLPDILANHFDKNRAEYHFQKVLKGESFTLSEEFIHNGSQSTHWESHYIPLYENEKIIGITMVFYDLTHHVNITRDFNELKIFEKIIDFIDAGIIIVDPNQDNVPIVYANNSFFKITGYKKEELIGENSSFLDTHALDKEELKILKDSIENKTKCELVIKANRKDGSVFISLVNLTPILDKDKKVIYLAGVLMDISDTVEAKRLEVIKKLSSGLTHELNTALTSMNGNMEMLGYDIETLKDETLKQDMNSYLRSIVKSKKVLSSITDSLHYLNTLPIETQEKTNIVTALFKSLEEFKEKIEQSEIEVRINNEDILKSKDLKIFYNIEEKVLIHLCSIFLDNSIDSLVMRKGLKTLSIDLYENKEKIFISVTDNGTGIPSSLQNELFQPLIKGKKFKGIGMGLFNAKNIIETYNGTISFYSENTQTTFDIVFYKI